MPSGSTYRPDIDGLRAIAVLSVIAFHLAPQIFPGGYLGVDIFFVLSGYLITGIIHDEIRAGHFTLRGFYERRFRRIVPALVVVLICISIVAGLILLPTDLFKFGKALLATIVFVPNVYAWLDTGYFSARADQKPLLHMWSLGVEEQFYLLFPLLLMLLMRNWRRLTLPLVIATSCASLALHVLALRFTSGTAAFYMLPTRAWELGVGATLALAPHISNPDAHRSPIYSVAGASGLGLIAWGLSSSPEYGAPVFQALLAVGGTALLIRIGQYRNPVSSVLSSAPFVWIGLISYSLYLWHWPVIVFAKYYLTRELRPSESALAVLLMFAAAAISWRVIERPFRRKGSSVRFLYVSAAATSIALAVSAVIFIQSRGLVARLSPAATLMNNAVGTHFQCDSRDIVSFGATRLCGLNIQANNQSDVRLALLGNSHAEMYAPVWREILEQRGESGLLVAMTGCLPTVVANYSVTCVEQAKAKLAVVSELPDIRTIVVGITWFQGDALLVDPSGRRLDNHDDAALIVALDDLIYRLHERGKRVVLIGPIAIPGWNMASEIGRKLMFGRPVDRPLALARVEFERQYDAVFNHFSGRQDVVFVRPDLVQCDGDVCPYVIDGRPLFSDESHLAQAEVGRFREIFMTALN